MLPACLKCWMMLQSICQVHRTTTIFSRFKTVRLPVYKNQRETISVSGTVQQGTESVWPLRSQESKLCGSCGQCVQFVVSMKEKKFLTNWMNVSFWNGTFFHGLIYFAIQTISWTYITFYVPTDNYCLSGFLHWFHAHKIMDYLFPQSGMLYSLVKVYWLLEVCSASIFDPGVCFQHPSKLLPDYMTSHPRR
jgi:hypothetical protein